LLPETSAAEGPVWVTGRELREQLAAPVSLIWEGNPLRPAIMNLSRNQHVAILIDRRVDPGQKLQVSLKQVPLESAVKAIADDRELGVCRLPWGIYLGPPAAAERFEAVRAALGAGIRRLPAAVQRQFRQSKALAWEDLATPRGLVEDLAGQNGIEIANLHEIPHDLWAAESLPAMPLADRLLAITIQYDLTLKFLSGGTQIELAPIPDNVRPLSKSGRSATGSPASPRRTAGHRASQPAEQRHTLTVREKPLEPVLQQLSQRLDFELQIDRKSIEAAGISLDQRVSVHVENATLDELLRSLLKDTGLGFHRAGRVVEVEAGG
jgi:hypothetical protein